MDIDSLTSSTLEANHLPSDHTETQTSYTFSRKPYSVIVPRFGWQAVNLRQLWQFRDLLVTLAERDIKLRYRQTALGIIWVIFQPLIAAGILSLVFGVIAKVPKPQGNIPLFVFAYAGMLGWNIFSSIITKSSVSLIQNAQLISKVFFPRLILPLSTAFSALLDFVVALALMVIFTIWFHITPGIGLLLLPLWILLILMLSLGVGLITSALTVSYRDVQYILPVLTQFLLYASPVGYTTEAVPARIKVFYFLNPLSSLLEAFRWSILGQGELHWGYIAYSGVFAICIFTGGMFAFRNMERRFADVI